MSRSSGYHYHWGLPVYWYYFNNVSFLQGIISILSRCISTFFIINKVYIFKESLSQNVVILKVSISTGVIIKSSIYLLGSAVVLCGEAFHLVPPNSPWWTLLPDTQTQLLPEVFLFLRVTLLHTISNNSWLLLTFFKENPSLTEDQLNLISDKVPSYLWNHKFR